MTGSERKVDEAIPLSDLPVLPSSCENLSSYSASMGDG